jgi:hypothetical protein
MAIPTDIANLKLWLKADSLALSNNDAVSTWADDSGQDNDAVQATSGYQPVFKTNELTTNALPSIYFHGDNLDLGTSLSPNAFTMFLLVKPVIHGGTYIMSPSSSYDYYMRMLYDYGWINKIDIQEGVSTPVSDQLTGSFDAYQIIAIDNNNVDTTRFFDYTSGSEVARGSGGRFNWINCYLQRIGNNLGQAAGNEVYIAEVVFYDVKLSDANRQAIGDYLYNKYFVLSNVPPDTPTITTPTANATNVSRNPTLESSAFSDDDVGDTHQASDWKVCSDSGLTTVVWSKSDDGTNLESIVVNATNGTFAGVLSGLTLLDAGTDYYVSVRHQDSADNWSEWATASKFTTIPANAPPDTPSITSPTDTAIGIGLTPTLISSAFSDDDEGDTHQASRWQLATDDSFINVVWDSGTDTTNKTTTTVNDTNGTFSGSLIGATSLDTGRKFYAHVKYQDSADNWSAYSTAISFTTVTLIELLNNLAVTLGNKMLEAVIIGKYLD